MDRLCRLKSQDFLSSNDNLSSLVVKYTQREIETLSLPHHPLLNDYSKLIIERLWITIFCLEARRLGRFPYHHTYKP